MIRALALSILCFFVACQPDTAARPEANRDEPIANDEVIASEFAAANPAAVPDLAKMVSLLLLENKYFFPAPGLELEPDAESAIKRFQRDHGFEATGRITEAQFKLLTRGLGGEVVDVGLPGGPYILELLHPIGQRVVTVSGGTWVFDEPVDMKPAAILNTNKIRCQEKSAVCLVATAQIPNAGKLLSLDMTIWDIQKWSQSEIVATRDAECRAEELTINWITDTALIEGTSKPSAPGCEQIDARRRISKLVNGFEISREYSQKTKEERFAAWNSVYRDWMKAQLPD